ncbi:MAG: hypothetical protein J5548_04470 [Prevotella sp.]|nr:hypothetical protein [Prevotella sp.]
MDMTMIFIVAAIVIILAAIFLRRHDDSKSDYKEQPFVHSGKKWVFNGILDIDHPPLEASVFTEYEGELQLMVKKGYVHYDISLLGSVDAEEHLGLFKAEALAKPDGSIVLLVSGAPFATLSKKQPALHQKIMDNGGGVPAYGFIAKQNDRVIAEACILGNP